MSEEEAVILVSEGDNFENSVAAVMYQARTLVSRAKKASSEWDKELNALAENIKPQWMENWYDGLGFCRSIVIQIPIRLADND